MKKIIPVFFIIQVFFHPVFAQTWTGAVSTDWNNSGNWTSPSSVPGATGNVVIPASVVSNRWPAFNSDVTINSITANPGCQLNVNGHTLNIVTTNAYNFIQGTINNTNAGTDIEINLNTGANGYQSFVRNANFTDHVIFNLYGSNAFLEDDAGSGNIFSGNATFNISSSMAFYLSHGVSTQFGSNLVISRTMAGNTQLFNAGGSVAGNFSYTNNTAGDSRIGNLSDRTMVAGTLNITANYTSPDVFLVLRLINQTSGGSINIQNSQPFDFELDTIKVNTLSINGYRGNAYARLLGNSISGNITLSDDASYAGGFVTFIRNNLLTGSFSLTLKGSNGLSEADEAGTGNVYNGNAVFNAQGTAAFFLSHGAISVHNGNLAITRTATGHTQAFNAGGNVKGNFSYTNLVNGNSYFGNTSNLTLITGAINIQVKDASPADFVMYHVKNQTGGGTITIDSTKGFDMRMDTLLLSNLNCLRYYGASHAYMLNNSITATINIANDISYQGGFTTQIKNNVFTGNTSFTNKGINALWEADGTGTGNVFNGNTSFTATGSGAMYISHGSLSKFNGNLTITRTGGGHTQAFNAGGTVSGNFSYTNLVNGNSYFGNSNIQTPVNGTINIQVKNSTPGDFAMYRVTNKTNGGSISLDSTRPVDFRFDTLLLVNMTCQHYYGSAHAYLLNNSITGAITVSGDAAYAGGWVLQIRNNLFNGNCSFTHKGSNNIVEADAENTGNVYNGNTSFSSQGTAALYISHASRSQFNGNLSITRTAGGFTQAFNAGGNVTGNFSYTNLVNGDSYFGNLNSRTLVKGTVDVLVKNSIPGDFLMHRFINQTNGGSISLDSTHPFNFQNDTLLLNNFNCQHYYGAAYSYLYRNSITATTTISDDISYAGGWFLAIRNNVFTGNCSFTHKGNNNIEEATDGGSGNSYNGNTIFTMQGIGSLYASHAAASQFNGNLSIIRNTTAGLTQVFNSPGNVTGNFSFTNNIGGACLIGNTAGITIVNGQVNMAIVHTTPADMVMQRLKNLTSGGTINIQNTRPFDFRMDTLLVNQFSITGFRGSAYANLLNNSITGDVTIASDAAYIGGWATFIRGNLFTGNSNFTNKGLNAMYSSDADPLGNKFAGNTSFTKTGNGPVYIGQNYTDEVTNNFTMTATGGINIGNLSFTGIANDTIMQGGIQPITIGNLSVKKTGNAAIILHDSVMVAGHASFTRGYIIAGANKELIFLNGALQTGASDSSHAQGPVSKIGNQAFSFPVGNGQAIQTAAISAPSITTDRYRVEYFATSSNPVYDTSKHAPSLNNVSGVQYWLIDRLAGASNVLVTLEYGPPRGVAITDNQAAYRVARWTGSTWSDLGNGAVTGTVLAGTVQTASAVNNFSPFTIAAISGIDPLKNTPDPLSPACANSILKVNFLSSGTFNAGNVFTAQLSNAAGSFASPLNIGTLAAAPSGFNVANFINAYLPSGSIATGTGYRVRVISNNPVQTGGANGSNITINSLYLGPDTTVALSCPGSTVNLLPLYNTTGLTAHWNTGNPSAAPLGNYRLDVTNGIGCKDTAFAQVSLMVASWTGTISNDWHVAGNWSTSKVPDDKTHVIVSVVAPNPCIISNANAQAASVQVKNGATVKTINTKQLVIKGNCTTLPSN